jgi:aminoglycoside 2''-phosphotransferase
MDSQETYLNRIRERFPDLSISDVAVADGLDNVAVMVNDSRVFRFARHARAKEQLVNEARVLRLIRPLVDVRVPAFDCCEDDFVTYEMIPGAPLCRHDILAQDEAVQDRLAEQLATFLRQLHAIPVTELEAHHVALSYAAHCHAVWVRQFGVVQARLFPHMPASAREWVKSLYEPVLSDEKLMDYQPALAYSDVAPGHILCDGSKKRINGVIDFGVAGIGDPAIDFAWTINYYGESFLRRMQKFYPEIEDAIERARFLAGAQSLAWASAAAKSEGEGSVKWRAFALTHIGFARDVGCVGSGWLCQ